MVRNMILKDKIFYSIKGKILEDLYNRLMNRKSRVIKEENKIRVNIVKKICIVNNDEELEEILKGIVSLLRIRRDPFFLWVETMKR